MIKQIENKLIELRKTKPLVLNLTNYVTMDFMANALLALGAAPIMSVCEEELEELVKISHSININIGTLDESFIKRCYKAVELAKQYQKPVVLDPVGSGASFIRTKTARKLMEYADIVRGNASEIMSLKNNGGKTLGVESVNSTGEAQNIARALCKQYGCTVVVSGPIDFITDGERETEVRFGSPLMPLVTGMGCTLTAVIAALRGISDDAFESAAIATNYFGLCGNMAESKALYSGTFRTAFIDALHEANFAKMHEKYRAKKSDSNFGVSL